MPDEETPDDVWCDVCQEYIPADYADAHAHDAPPEAIERLKEMLERHKDARTED